MEKSADELEKENYFLKRYNDIKDTWENNKQVPIKAYCLDKDNRHEMLIIYTECGNSKISILEISTRTKYTLLFKKWILRDFPYIDFEEMLTDKNKRGEYECGNS